MRASLSFVFGITLLRCGAAPPTFYKDVLPILREHCESCHRPGEAAPMPLQTYQQVRPYARAIRQAVLRGTMPPWFAEAPPGRFANDHRLTSRQIAVIRRWTDGGAPSGSPAGAQQSSPLPVGWRIGTPDTIFALPQPYRVPAKGDIDYQHFIVPTGFSTPQWVQAVEVRPTARAAVHHAVVFVRPPRSIWLRSKPAGTAFSAKGEELTGLSVLDEAIATYLPGAEPLILQPGQAKLIPADSDLIFQIHYTATGREELDQTRIGLIFSKQPPISRLYTLSVSDGTFEIPPGAPAHAVRTAFRLQTAVELYGMAPHMHLRGKSMRIRAIPGENVDDAEPVELLNVPRYDFYWQLVYRLAKPLPLARGTRIEVEAVFDNSRANPRNPDPNATVRWGEQSWQEMMVAFLEVLLPAGLNPAEIFRPKRF